MPGFERQGQTQHKVHALRAPTPNLLAHHQGLQVDKVLQEAKRLLNLQVKAQKQLSEPGQQTCPAWQLYCPCNVMHVCLSSCWQLCFWM